MGVAGHTADVASGSPLRPWLDLAPDLGSFTDGAAAVLLLLVAGGYVLAFRRLAMRGRRKWWPWLAAFLCAVGALGLAILGPPGRLNAELLSIHMVQHVLVGLVAPPLLLLGRPDRVLLAVVGHAPAASIARMMRRWGVVRAGPFSISSLLVVFLLNSGSLVLWHWPLLYEAALQEPTVHHLEHGVFLGTGLLFWWVVLSPGARRATGTILLVFATWMVNDLLGAVLALSPELLYPSYSGGDALRGTDPVADQRLAGLLMWVGGGVLYAGVLFWAVVFPAGKEETSGAARSAVPNIVGFRESRKGVSQ